MSELALRLIAENKKSKSKVLDLGGSEFAILPEELKECIWLEELNFSSSKLLYDISLLAELENLQLLACYNTQISDLSALSNLKKLRHFSCQDTPVSDLAPLSNLLSLQELDFSNTKVFDLSPLRNLVNLQKLYCYQTAVFDLLPLENLHNLKGFNCSDTKVSDLSPLLPLIKKGRSVLWEPYAHDILVTNCPLIHPPPEIVKQGNTAILNYFAEREKLQFKNTEIKLILVGNSTSGKTSLSRFLRERLFQFGQPSTHGIKTEKWQPEGHEMQVNIWDFGGQEYYHATHRLFLSQNAIYLLLWDAQTDTGGNCETSIHFDNDLEPSIIQLEHFPQKWWIQNIRHYTRESNPPVPVLLVQNKCVRDGVLRVSDSFGKSSYNLQPEWLDNHIDLEATAAHIVDPKPETRKWQRNFETFEERLLELLQSQMATYEFAVYHRDIRDKVRQLAAEGVNNMFYPDFEHLCRDIEADAKMDLVQIYLRDITGDILYYPHNERLRERVFLRPVWVCNNVYQILSRQVQEQNGIFGVDWVCTALQCNESNALDFVELMREFELVFDDTDDTGNPTGQFVAPQYLPDTCTKPDKLEAAKEYVNLSHAFTLWFPDFLPKSHIARFVAYWGSQAKQRLFWKNGLLFQTENCTALVERTTKDKIQVEIQANHPKRVEAMERVFQSFIHLEDGQAGFAVSLDGNAFVWWGDVQEAMHMQARQIKTYPPETTKYIDLIPFAIFSKNPKMTTPKKVFISYSHKDEEAMKELDKFLGPLERKGDISIWTDRKILPGQNWKEEILRELESANLTLLLVSANFLDSDFIHEEEIPRAFQRMDEHGKKVIPIILNFCLWDITPLGVLQATPKDGRPIADYSNSAQAWSEVARGILALLNI